MSALVAYQSSDDEEEPVQAPENDRSLVAASINTPHQAQPGSIRTALTQASPSAPPASVESTAAPPPLASTLLIAENGNTETPTVLPGPTALPVEAAIDLPSPTADPAMSPYSTNREKMQSLTMPRFANFNIPPSPPPPESTSEAAADLLARTRKFERFLQLKKQGVHFNDRLESSTALRNPALLQKLMAFAGIDAEEQYDNTLGEAVTYPTKWPDGFLESLIKDNESRQKKEKEGRSRVNFVPARSKKSG